MKFEHLQTKKEQNKCKAATVYKN